MDTTFTNAGGVGAPPREIQYFEADVSITSVGGIVGGSFTVSGTATCERLKDIPGDETGIPVRNADADLTAVAVTFGNGAAITATPTGPAATPWTSWTVAVSGQPDGQLTIVAQAFPSRDAATASRTVIVDITPPTLTINPPADVITPAPPFIATITGTAADNASGVAGVEWQFAGGAISTAGGTTTWVAQVPLPGLGDHVVSIRARDNLGNVGAMQNVTVHVGDITPPAIAFSAPPEGEARALVDGKATFEIRGTASDTQTGVGSVEWSLDGGSTFTAAVPQGPGDWSTWSAPVPITVAGNHTITVRATDLAQPGNLATAQRGVVVAERFEPADPDAVFSPAAYLDDLLDFATHRATTVAGGPFVTRQLLIDAYLQPFADLVTRDNRSVANQPVSQLRLCVDVLRRYLAGHGGGVPADAEAAYRQAVYVAVLRQLGTSFEEMRLARVADEPARAALADRLGIALDHFRPDRLDQLLVQPADLTEPVLKALFGLEETTIKPLSASLLPEPSLLIWQKERLRVGWKQQDDAARTDMDTPLPLIDPDLLAVEDLRTANPGDPAYDLWKARQDDLAAHLAELDAFRKGQRNQQAGFDKIVAALGPIPELLALADDRAQGKEIDAQLRAKHLSLQAFLHLIRVRKLAAAGTVLDTEWADVYAILVQVRKIGLYPAWRRDEQKKGLILGPDAFRLAGDGPSAAVLPTWRSTSRARQVWLRTLESRMQQELTLTQALQSVVIAAEQDALPLLRQACLAAIAGDRDPVAIANRLTRELGIDCQDAGHRQTARAQQALETLQEVLLSLRTGQLKTEPPVLGEVNPAAAWVLAVDPAKPYQEADFDEEWLWMGGYATWNAAIRVFAYPESYLLPELRPGSVQTGAYRQLMTDLRNQPRLTPVQARTMAAAYLTTLRHDLGAEVPDVLGGSPLVITEELTDAELSTADRHRRAARAVDAVLGGSTPPAGDLLLRADGARPSAPAIRAVPGGPGLDRDLLHRSLRARRSEGLSRADARGGHRHPVSAQPRQLVAGRPEPPRDRVHPCQRLHPLHAHDTGPLLPRLRRCRVHPRRRRVRRPGARTLRSCPGAAGPAGHGPARNRKWSQPVPAEPGSAGPSAARGAQPVQAP